MEITAFDVAFRFAGMREVPGGVSNPAILAMLQLDAPWAEDDEVPWCSAFVNYVAWLLGLCRSRSLAARSWLGVGNRIDHEWLLNGYLGESGTLPERGFDIVILNRAGGPQDPNVSGPGHVGFFAGWRFGESRVQLLSGNHADSVALGLYDAHRILGIRRLYKEG